jgi:hypothetical protein
MAVSRTLARQEKCQSRHPARPSATAAHGFFLQAPETRAPLLYNFDKEITAQSRRFSHILDQCFELTFGADDVRHDTVQFAIHLPLLGWTVPRIESRGMQSVRNKDVVGIKGRPVAHECCAFDKSRDSSRFYKRRRLPPPLRLEHPRALILTSMSRSALRRLSWDCAICDAAAPFSPRIFMGFLYLRVWRPLENLCRL